jgi:hypothetical protein
MLRVDLALLACVSIGWSSAPAAEEPPIRALLVCGGCCHDYARQKKILTRGISARADVVWTVAHDPDNSTGHPNPVYLDPDWAKGFDVVVHDECSADVTAKAFVDGILAPHRRGLPAMNLHCAMHCYRVPDSDEWFRFTGLTTHSHGAQLPIAIAFDPAHPIAAPLAGVVDGNPIAKGLEGWTTINEEQYRNEKVWDTVTPLAHGKQGNDDDLVAWTNDYHGAKVFSTTLGHNNETVADPRYLDLVTRGLLWSVGRLDAQHFHAAALPAEREDLAKGRPATASSTENAGHSPAKATDGDDSTRWCASNASVPQWLQVDLGKPQDLGGCEVVWEADPASYTYTIKGSADATRWTTLVDSTTAKDDDGVFPFTALGTRYLRIEATAVAPGKWVSVCSFRVFGPLTKTAR